MAARRLRRTRLVSTLVLVAGLVGFVLGVTGMGWLLAVTGSIASVGSVLVLVQLAAVSQARARRAVSAPVAAGVPVAQPFQDFAPQTSDAGPSSASVEAESAQDPAAAGTSTDAREWTPVALPRPLYLRRGSARALARSSAVASSPTSAADADALREAATRSAEQLRQQQDAARLEAQRQALREVARAEAALQTHRDGGVVARGGVAGASGAGAAGAPAAGAAAAGASGVGAAAAPAAPPVARVEVAAPVAPAQSSRFARMGYVDETDLEELRIDEILQRRRAV